MGYPKRWLFVVALSVTVVIVWALAEFGFWNGLDRTAPVAEWGVAVGTLVLALATFQLARRAQEEATAVREEAAQVGDQVALQREQMAAAMQPVVYPTTPADWALGRNDYAGRRNEVLVVTNGGPGAALNVSGRLMRRPPAG